jgi:hypothetical protein
VAQRKCLDRDLVADPFHENDCVHLVTQRICR